MKIENIYIYKSYRCGVLLIPVMICLLLEIDNNVLKTVSRQRFGIYLE